MPEKHTFEFTFPDGRIPDASDQQRLLEDLQLFASRLGAHVVLSSVEKLEPITDYSTDSRIQAALDYELRSDDRISQRTRNILGGYGGFLSCRDVLVTGQDVLSDIRGFGESCLASVKTVVADKVPQIPFLTAPDAAFAATFCTSTSQIHFGATGSWNAGSPTRRVTVGDVVANPKYYPPVIVRDARVYSQDFRAARKEINAQRRSAN